MIRIYNEDCFDTMKKIGEQKINIILTSPFYNTNRRNRNGLTLESAKLYKGRYPHVRYDMPVDTMSNDQYNDFTVNLFNEFDKILKENGVILYNICYGSENTVGMFLAISKVIENTPFTIADVIVWKKKSAVPNSCSPNKLTRIWEFVFVICRKDEIKSFQCNKKIKSHRKTGQACYEVKYNFIEAKNNDGQNPYNKATYSSDLCKKLLSIYGFEGDTVYDPFIGTGTTAIACNELGMNCIGSEISKNQCDYAEKRLKQIPSAY